MDNISTENTKAEPISNHPPAVIPKIDVQAMLFKAANIFRSNEDTRYYLQGVFVQPHPEKGAVLTATDGHRLMCIHDETGVCSQAAIITVEARAFAGIKVDKKKPDDVPRLRLDAEGCVIVGTYRSLKNAVIDGTYPDYLRVIMPIVQQLRSETFVPASFNHRYLAGFSSAAEIINGNSDSIRMVTTSESDPAVILFERAPHAFGVLMPMRSSMSNGMPAFMRPLIEPLEAREAARKAELEAEEIAAKKAARGETTPLPPVKKRAVKPKPRAVKKKAAKRKAKR